jgi:hypothetical protein
MPGDPKLPGLYLAVNGVPSGLVHNDTNNLLTPLGQNGPIFVSYLNMMSPTVTQRALDTSQVVCGYAWASTGAGPGRGVRRCGSDVGTIPAILLGLSLGIIGTPELPA